MTYHPKTYHHQCYECAKARHLAFALNIMKRHFLALTCFLFYVAAHADGLPLKDGRYPGPTLALTLTQEQKHVIEHFRTCHRDNWRTMNLYTPYVFTLTQHQAARLKAKIGFTPETFEVYETYLHFNDAGPHWNLALRFSEDEIEIPLDLVVENERARKEHEMQGWETSNPCFPLLGKPGAQQGL